MHGSGILAVEPARDDVRRVPIAAHELEQLGLGDAREHGRVRDLVPVQVQDRQDHAVPGGIEELVRVPSGCERTGLGLAVTDHTGREESGIVEDRAIGVRQRVPQLAALMDRAGVSGRRGMGCRPGTRTGGTACAPLLAPVDLVVELGVGAVQIRVRDHRRAAVPWAGEVDRGEPSVLDRAIQVRVDEVEAGRRSPVAEQARLDVLGREGFAQQRVGEQVDLADGKVVRGPPPGVEPVERRLVDGARRSRAPSGHVLKLTPPGLLTEHHSSPYHRDRDDEQGTNRPRTTARCRRRSPSAGCGSTR